MHSQHLRLHGLWLSIGWCLVAALVYVSLMPKLPEIAQHTWDKANHSLSYAGLMLWFAQIYTQRARRVCIALALIALGVVLEALQGLGSTRSPEFNDAVANAFGVGVGFALGLTPLAFLLRWIERGWRAR